MKKRFEIEEVLGTPKLIIVDLLEKEEPFFVDILRNFSEKIDLYLLTRRKTKVGRVHTLSSLSIHFLNKLKEKVEYALILASPKEKSKLLEYAEKLSASSQKVVVVIERKYAQQFLEEIKILQNALNISVVFLGEVFGENYPHTFATKIILRALSQKKFLMPENPLYPLFLVSENDMLSGLEYVMFSKNTLQAVYPLYYKDPQTATSLVHALRRVDHEMSVSYPKNYLTANVKSMNDKELEKRLGPLSTNIRKVFQGFEKSIEEIIHTGEIKNISYERKNKLWKYTINTFKKSTNILLFLFFTFILFIAVSIGGLFLSINYFKNATESLYLGNLSTASKNIQSSKTIFTFVSPQLSFVFSQADFISGGNISSYLTSYSDALSLTNEAVKILEKSLAGGDLSSEDANSFIGNAFVLYFILQQRLPEELRKNPHLEKYLPLFQISEEALGFTREMEYLVLLQNNTELRPTGGFIGSVARISVKNGKVGTTEVHDVYELDGQLTEHVEPHYVIRRYLQPHLYLRDSNFNPDFEKSASAAANLYLLEGGRKIDGVIAIDTEVLKALLDMLGPIQIPGIQKPLDKETIVSVIHDEIHDDFFPGSTEKKDLLSQVLSRIVIALEDDPRKQMELVKKLPELFSKKHIQVSFQEDYLQKGAVAAGIAGSTVDLRLGEAILKDTFSINEANIGVNKVNSLVSREATHAVALHENELVSDTLLEYKNEGNEDYTMYLRLIAPKEALLEGVVIDGGQQTIVPAVTDPVFYERRGFTPPVGLEVFEEELGNNLKAFGFRVVVPRNSEKRIRFITRRPFFELPATFDYSLRFIKQPGTLPYPLTVTFQKDPLFKSKNSDMTLFNGVVTGDMETTTRLQKTSQ